ncbi:TPA: hypothetical protein L4T57_004294 [Pseudomonas aeruginosa]|uniref:hypothetical protein n=1 Tax=Pseudomonas aeruginosa TaxID=287 RepID=UPI00300421FC|nr:hypothetical protein [Pseudomonas aeruginosa]
MSDSNEAKVAKWMEKETLAEHLGPLLERYDVKYRGHGIIYVDHEQYNILTIQQILADMSSYLGVSKELIRSRLIDFGWLIDVRRVLPVRDSAARVIDNLESWAADEPEENDPEMDDQYDRD